jgi:Uncharacterized conserved protein (DUF2285)
MLACPHVGVNLSAMTFRPITTLAPTGKIAPYDRECATVYLRLLDAEAAGAPWREAAEVVLGLGADVDDDWVCRIHQSHLARAHWLVDGGYKDLLTLPYEDARGGANPGSR